MTWICLDDDQLAIVKRGLDREVAFHLVSPHKEETIAAQECRDWIKQITAPNPRAELYHDIATDFDGPYRLSEPDEFENPPYVSESDEGAYVMAWVWVDRPKEEDIEDD